MEILVTGCTPEKNLMRLARQHILGLLLASCIVLLVQQPSTSFLHHTDRDGLLEASDNPSSVYEDLASQSTHVMDLLTSPPKRYEDDDVLPESDVSYEWMMSNVGDTNSVSAYETRWPDYGLPKWAKKIDLPGTKNTPPKDKRVCFVHLGKTGGSSISCSLGFMLHCDKKQDLSIPPGLLPHYATNTIHNGVNDCPNHMPYYLFSLRDPLDRIRSGYVYDRRAVDDPDFKDRGQANLYKKCPFWTLNDLAEKGLDKNSNVSETCRRRAREAIQGWERYGYHLYFNHRWYLQTSGAFGSKILALRMEHMVDDWNSVEEVLGGEAGLITELPHANKAKKSTIEDGDKHLSDRARTLLCEALCPEIQLYKNILFQAVNLSQKEVELSLSELFDSCPVEAKATSCPSS